MVDMGRLLTLQGQLFLLVLLGAFFRRRFLDDHFQKELTDVVVNLILPCNILHSFQMDPGGAVLRQAGTVIACSAAVQLGSWALALILYRRFEADKKPVVQYGTLCSNAGFLGTPIAEGMFGNQGVMLASLYLIPLRIMMWTVGLSFYTGSGKGALGKTLRNPCLIAVFIGAACMLLHISYPAVLSNTIGSLSSCNMGMSMFLIRMIVSDFHLGTFANPRLLYFCAVRLFLLPMLTLTGGKLLNIDPLPFQLMVMLTCMPAGASTAILAERYGGNASFAAGCVTISTAFSLIATPLWCLAL